MLTPKNPQVGQQIRPQSTKPSFIMSILRYADSTDYLLIVLGTIGSLGTGAVVPIFISLLALFSESYQETDHTLIKEKSYQNLIVFVQVGGAAFVCGWTMISLWMITGERLTTKFRKAYFEALLKQEIGFFDCLNQAQISSKFSIDTSACQQMIGQKLGLILQIVGSFLSTLIISFNQGWLLTLVCLSSVPFIILSAHFNIVSHQTKDKQALNIYLQAGGRAQQALASIKTVKQLSGQEHEFKLYQSALQETQKNRTMFSFKIGLSNACMHSTIFMVYALGFWEGSNCVQGNSSCPESVTGRKYAFSNVQTVFFTILLGTFLTLSQLSPALKKIAEGRAALERIFNILDRSPAVKNTNNAIIPEIFQGKIEFQNVKFAFPKNKGKLVLNGFSGIFDLSSTALVGDSGCGKSTVLQLLMRFYDPDQGCILLDGTDLRELDLNWLRSQIGYVGQQPVLFATSIRENLLLGNPEATQEQIDEALHQAEAYDFVYGTLEKKLETFVGAGGGQISGGQKQRIAIARALLKKPKILLLDEATSALDRRNEKLIQRTFDKISEKLTTVTVAHRVPTIMNANLICVIKEGRIQEQGRFQQLRRYQNYKAREQDSEEKVENQKQAIYLEDLKHNLTQDRLNIKQLDDKHVERSEKIQGQGLAQKQDEENEIVQKYKKGMFFRIFSYNKKQIPAFIVVLLVSILSGLLYPVFSIYLSRMLISIMDIQHPQRSGTGREDANNSALAFLILSIITFILYLLQSMLGEIVGDEITNNLRMQTYQKFLKMPMNWFNKKENNSGKLSMYLSTSCRAIHGMTTTYVFILLQCIFTLIGGFSLSFYFEWRITFVALGMVPLLILAGAIRATFKTGLSRIIEKVHQEAGGMINETMINIRTVLSLGVEPILISRYGDRLLGPQAQVIKAGTIAGLMNGISVVCVNLLLGILFYIGTIFLVNLNTSILDLFTAIFQCFFISISIGNNVHFLPDTQIASKAAAKIFQILDSEDQQQLQIRQQSKMLQSGFQGSIKFEGVQFTYENRKIPVFQNLNIQIQRGQRIAFVGPSGCGKSTILQLILRFYQPSKGRIIVGNTDIKDFDLGFLRRQFGVVSQQPVLFNGSFAENIRYDNTAATIEQLRIAATQANALTFIDGEEKLVGEKFQQGQGEKQIQKDEGFQDNKTIETIGDNEINICAKEGFGRVIGLKGFHISGGQKQRVAIARAILRNPSILLLDQATSALDAENERIVQASLERIMEGRTTVTVAHRMETLRNAEKICVLEHGSVVETGSFETLLQKKGYFYDLARGHQTV